MYAHDAAEWAAALAYYGLLSTFPLLLVAGTAAAYFVEPAWAVERATVVLGEFLPEGEEEIERIVNGAVARRDRIGFFSGVALLWTGSRVFVALAKALNAIRGTDDQEDVPRRALLSIVMLVGIGLVFVLALASGALVDIAWDYVGVFPGSRGTALLVVRQIVRALMLFVAFALIYQFVPRGRQPWRPVLVGAAGATLLFLAARELFLFAIRQSVTYQVTYGPLAVAAILMLWVWTVAFVTLYGGEIAAIVGGTTGDAPAPRSASSEPQQAGDRPARAARDPRRDTAPARGPDGTPAAQ